MTSAFLKSTVCAVKDQVFSNLGNESVILHVKSGAYYGLNEVGTRIWQMIQAPQAVTVVRDDLLSEYDVQSSQLESDLENILNHLLKAGLIEICDEKMA